MIIYNTEDTEFIIATPGIIEAPPYLSHLHCHVLRTDPVLMYIYSLDPSIAP
jgi:hypothetical protein